MTQQDEHKAHPITNDKKAPQISDQKAKQSWKETMSVYFQWPIIQVFILGIASGFPLLLTGGTLSARLFDSGIDIKTIGILASLGIPYSLKFLIAPVIDHVKLPRVRNHLQHRRGWCFLLQYLLSLSLLGMAGVNPQSDLGILTILALTTAILSATQDIVVDAMRVEMLKKADQGAGAAASVAGYRIGMLLAGAGAFIVADHFNWPLVYLASGFLMFLLACSTLLVKRLRGYEESQAEQKGNELETEPQAPNFTERFIAFVNKGIIAPFKDFFKRPAALYILLFIALFKLGDAMAGSLSSVFYMDLGFTKTQIAAITKVIGVLAVLGGTFIGGFITKRMTILNALVICGILQIASNFVFVWLNHVGAELDALTICIIVENVTGGMGTAAFVAYLSQLCNVKFTATQYALFSSLSSVGRTLFASSAGFLQAIDGWGTFYVITAFFGVPGMIAIYFVQRQETISKRLKTPEPKPIQS